MKKYFSFDKNLNLKQVPAVKKKEISKKINSLLANYASIGYYLVTPLLVGVFLGLYLEKATGKNIFVIFGVIIGSTGTFYNLFRLIK